MTNRELEQVYNPVEGFPQKGECFNGSKKIDQ